MKTGKASFAKLHKVIPGLLASLWMMLCLSACTGYGEEVSEGSWKAILKNDHKEAFVCEYQWDGSDEGLRIDARSVNGIPVTRYGGYIGRGLPVPFTIVAVTDEQGIKTIYEYDRDGKIQIEEKYDASGAVSWSTQYSYDEAGRETLCVMVGPNDEPKSYRKKVYDGDGNLTEEYTGTSPEDARLHYRYTYEDGKLVTEANINEDGSYFDLEFYEYDEQGRLSRKTKQSEDGYVYRLWEYTYTEEGWLGHVTDTHYEHRVETDYDAYGREIREEGFYNDEPSYTERFSYGEFGLVSYLFESVSGNKNHYVYYYDEAGRKISEVSVDEDGNETQIAFWEYDDRGNLIHSKKAKGYEYTAEYNEYGYPVKVHDVCTDMTRDAGTYDTLETYEYTYYDTMSTK
jgi:YD repeat-containing protein